MPLSLIRFEISTAINYSFLYCGPVCGPIQEKIEEGGKSK
jgi:hypothetical protein